MLLYPYVFDFACNVEGCDGNDSKFAGKELQHRWALLCTRTSIEGSITLVKIIHFFHQYFFSLCWYSSLLDEILRQQCPFWRLSTRKGLTIRKRLFYTWTSSQYSLNPARY